MRRYSELTDTEKKTAVLLAVEEIVDAVCSGLLVFEKNLQDLIDDAIEESRELRTPWFAGEMVYGVAGAQIDEHAQAKAMRTLYLDEDEHAVYLPKEAHGKDEEANVHAPADDHDGVDSLGEADDCLEHESN